MVSGGKVIGENNDGEQEDDLGNGKEAESEAVRAGRAFGIRGGHRGRKTFKFKL
jgi:hypothetical protein